MPPAFSLIAFDNFQRADESPLSNGGRWSGVNDDVFPHGIVSLVQHAVTTLENGRFGWALWLADSFPADQYSEFTILLFDVVTYFGPIVRAQNTTQLTGYSCEVEQLDAATASVTISRFDADAQVNLAAANVPCKVGDTVRLAAVGSSIIFYVNGVEQLRATDATYAGGRPGIHTFYFGSGSRSNNAISSWAAGAVGQSFGGGDSASEKRSPAAMEPAAVASAYWASPEGREYAMRFNYGFMKRQEAEGRHA